MVGSFLCSVAILVCAGDREPSVRDELARYYETSKMPASWEDSLKHLGAQTPAERKKAAGHLVELMEHSWQDERSGKAPWRATPFWGGRPENPAHHLRSAISDALEKASPTGELLPVLQWLLKNEPQMRVQERVAGYLGKIDGKDADDYRMTLVLQTHPNAVVASTVLDQLRERRAAVPLERLTELCHHHRKAIRDSARKLNAALKGADPGLFDPVQALKRPAVRKTLDELQALLIELPAKEADFVEIAVRLMDKGEVKHSYKAHGWLLKQDKSETTIYSPYGNRETYRDKEKTKTTVSERTENGVRSWEIDVIQLIAVTKVDVAGYVKDIAKVRAKGNESFELSARGGLTGQFEGQGASVPEVVLAGWLDRAGKPDLAAMMLLPALDTMYEDRHLVEMARHRLGDLLGRRMLVAFVGDRDYAEAFKLAQTLAKHYPDTQFFEYAKEFVQQLPRRMDDFKTLKLPTPDEWTELKKKLSRREQIDFLCQRLRLLNCFQMGQPGGYWPTAQQYAEACGLSENAAWGLNKGKTKVINPVAELTGERSWFGEEEAGKKPRGLELKVADIPLLVPYLREDWFLLIVGFWRDFHPSRDLSRSRTYVAGWINDLAQHDLVQESNFAKMTAEQQNEHLKRIIAWAEANKNKTREELIVDAVQADLERKGTWHTLADRVGELVKVKHPRALALVEHFLAEQDDDGYNVPALLDHMHQLQPPRAVEWAQKLLNHKSGRVRMQSAMLVFDSGDKTRVVPILAKLLKNGSPYDISLYAEKAIDGLLMAGTKEASAAALGVLENKGMHGPDTAYRGDDWPSHPQGIHRAAIVKRLAKAGHPGGFQIYLRLLDVKGNQYGGGTYGLPVAKHAVYEILANFGPEDAGLKKLSKIKDFEQQRTAVRMWVEQQLRSSK